MSSNKSFRTKVKLAKAAKRNGSVPHFILAKTTNTIRWNYKRRHWRRSSLKI